MAKIYSVKDKGFFIADSRKEVSSYFSVPGSHVTIIAEPENKKFLPSIQELKQRDFQRQNILERSVFFNEPTRGFEIGETIIYYKNKYKVNAIFAEGKVISYVDENNIHHFKPWHEVFKENNTTDFLINKDYMRLSFSNMDLESLVHRYYYSGIDMNPIYQRDLVWTLEQKVLLIDSIFNRVDIGKFVFVELPYKDLSPSFQVLDGKQRISTIIDFIECRFPYKGIYFSDLSYNDRRNLFNFSSSIATIDERHVTEKLVIEYFVKLNSTGTPVDPEFLDSLKSSYLK